ncbi:MAG: GGDEF domain-containing protein [Isosphaeraceae bacterium]
MAASEERGGDVSPGPESGSARQGGPRIPVGSVGHPLAHDGLSWFLAGSATTLVGRFVVRDATGDDLVIVAANPALQRWLPEGCPASLRGVATEGSLGHLARVVRGMLGDGDARVVRLELIGPGRRARYRCLVTADRHGERAFWLVGEPRRASHSDRGEAPAVAWEMALSDPLTGLRNRRWLDRWLAARGGRPGARWACLLVDLDGFKTVNETRGHAGGDRVLVDAARTLAGGVRGGDQVVRVGGDEFLVVLPLTDRAQAAHVAERLRTRLAADDPGAPASLGVAEHAPEETPEQTLARADAALRRAKAGGRNRVEIDAGVAAAPHREASSRGGDCEA